MDGCAKRLLMRKGGFSMEKKQRLLGVLAAAMAFASLSGSASAATGEAMFADVPAGHWAYAAVAQLKADGLIKGMSVDPFDGNSVVTRYQMAQLVASALAHEQQASAADQAAIERLSHEFDDEIQAMETLAKRVDALEKHQKKTEDNFTLHGDFQQTLESHNHAGGDTKKSRWWAKELYLNADAKLPKVMGDWKFRTQLETKFGTDQRINEEELIKQGYNGGHQYNELLKPNLAYFEGSLGKTQLWTRVGILQPWVQNGFVYAANLRGVMLEHYAKNYTWHAFGGLVDSDDNDLAVGAGAAYDEAAKGWKGEISQPWNDNVRAHESYYVLNNEATNWQPRLSRDGKTPLSEAEQAKILRNGGTGSDNAKGDLQDMFGSSLDTKKTVYGIAYDRMYSKRFTYSLGAYRYTSAAYNREPLYVGEATFDYKLMPKVIFRGTYAQGNQHGENSHSRGWMADLMWNCNPWMPADRAHAFGAYIGYHYLAPDAYIRCGYGDGIEKGQKGVEIGAYYNLTNNFQYTLKYGFGKSLTYTYSGQRQRDKLYSGFFWYF